MFDEYSLSSAEFLESFPFGAFHSFPKKTIIIMLKAKESPAERMKGISVVHQLIRKPPIKGPIAVAEPHEILKILKALSRLPPVSAINASRAGQKDATEIHSIILIMMKKEGSSRKKYSKLEKPYRTVDTKIKVFLSNLSESLPKHKGITEYVIPPEAPMSPIRNGEAPNRKALIETDTPTIPLII